MSIRLSISPLSKPLGLSELLPSTIEPIDHWAYQPLSLSTIEPIDHQAYQLLILFRDFLVFRLVKWAKNYNSE